jgi:hypothetical protein
LIRPFSNNFLHLLIYWRTLSVNMKRLALITIATLAFAGMTAAVVNEDGSQRECPPGQMCTMGSSGSSSATGSVAAGPNGTEYSAKTEMAGSQCRTGETDTVSNISYSSAEMYKVSFKGELNTPNPCHNLDHRVEKTAPCIYTINITTVPPENGSVCAQCLGSVNYDASFEADEPFTLKVLHKGEKVNELQHPEAKENTSDKEPDQNQKTSFFSGIANWFQNLF